MATAGKHIATTPSGAAIPNRALPRRARVVRLEHTSPHTPQLTIEMRLTSSGAYARAPPVPKMPAGLVELIEDLTRNVLRHNPTNVYEFCAGHMEKLLEIRGGHAPKPVLTLEQKIARVQEKLNKKAELRRQKYDKQMQLYRLNSKLEQTSEQREDQIDSLRYEPTNSFGMDSNEDNSKAKQNIATFSEENQTLHKNIVDTKSKESIEASSEQELNTKNSIQDFFQNNNKKNKESVETNPGLDVNIETHSKDSIETEKHVKQDIEMLDKIEESVTDRVNLMNEDKVETLKENSLEQDVQINVKVEEGLSNLVEDKTVFLHVEKDEAEEKKDEKDNEVQDGTESIKSIQVVNEKSNLVVAESNPKDSIEIPQTVMEIKNQKELVGELIAADQTTLSDTVEDKSKGPVHHEQDLADDLEVEIFHKQREPKNESMTASTETYTQTANGKFENYTDLYNTETGLPKNEKVNKESSEEGISTNYSSSDEHFFPFNQKEDLSEAESVKNLKRKFSSVDDHLKPSEVNSSECTDAANDTANLGSLLVTEKVAISEIPGAMTQENISDIDLKIIDSNLGSSSNYKTENFVSVSVASVVDKVGSDHKHPDEGVEAPLENIFNNDVAKDNDNMKRNVLDIKDKSPGDGVLEIPMQKKEYALLLPEIGADSETVPEPITLNDKTHEENVAPDNISDIANTSKKINENIVTSIEEFSGGVKETASIMKYIGSSVDFQTSETTDNPKEKDDNGTDIEYKLKENVIINLTEQNLDCNHESKAKVKKLNSDNEDQKFVKVFSDKHNETVISNDDIEMDSETAKLEDKSSDAKENISSYSDLTHKTETPIVNDSADESTVGDSNDSLMDQEVEIVTQSEENKNSSTMDLETAAITIQKVFRSFLFKSRCSTFEDTSTDEANPITDDDNDKEEVEYPIAKERRVLGITRMDTVLQTVNEEKSLSLSTDDSSTLSSAATVIQAHVKGFLTRNKFNLHKTTSNASLVNSDGPSTHSLEAEERQKKTILNIHIVPEGDHFLSRDESIITSMDLSLDGTPPSSVNLHPLGYDKSEPRKQLKREDAIQSISPPSNNSGKLSEDIDSVKEIALNDFTDPINVSCADTDIDSDTSPTKSSTLETVIETIKGIEDTLVSSEPEIGAKESDNKRTLTKMSSDEGDVVTPFEQDGKFSTDSDQTSGLLHSGEFHDIVLPTKVARSDTSVVRGE